VSVTTVDWVRAQDGQVAVVTLRGEARLNAIADATFDGLDRTLDEIEADAAIRVVIVAGAGGKAFCAGADLNEVAAMDALQFLRFSRRTIAMCRRLDQSARIAIAAVDGIAYGAGCALTMACDFVVAGRGARFAQPEINVGIVGGTALLPRRIASRALVNEMVLLGRSLSAEEAQAAGLVNRLADGDVLAAAQALAGELLAKPPTALALAKQALNRGRAMADPFAAFELQQELASLARGSADSRAAVERFVQKQRGPRP
jgi:enoyl-CoA hydratase